MQQAGVTSFSTLCQRAGVSRRQLARLRQGQVGQLSLNTLLRLSQALNLDLDAFLAHFSDLAPAPSRPVRDRLALEQECQRLQAQLQEQQQALWQEFQQTTLQTLESFLLQWPTAAHAAQNNPEAPALKILPLLRPVEQLLQEWGIETIGEVGAEVPYDPQQHQLMGGTVAAGDCVVVRFVGYRQGDKLLYRAKVAPKSL
jgi:transcriptional regulator with XRE-family HTH domain